MSGAPIGILLGLIMGLTVNPIAASVTGSLMVLLITISTVRGERSDGVARARGVAPHIVGFALAAVPAMLAGLYLRTHDSFSPPPSQVVDAWTAAGLDKHEAQSAALLKFGLHVRADAVPAEVPARPHSGELAEILKGLLGAIGHGPANEDKKVDKADDKKEPVEQQSAKDLGTAGTGLFAGRAAACRVLTKILTGAELASIKGEFKRLGPDWDAFANSDVKADAGQERTRLEDYAAGRCSK